MNLLSGYRHQRLRGIDTRIGRIWKSGGLSIRYEMGDMYSDQPSKPLKEWRRHCAWQDDADSHNKLDTGDVLCWIDADADGCHEVLHVLLPDYTEFWVFVKNQRQIDEALKMLLTYDPTLPQ